MEPVQQETYKGHTITIQYEDNPLNPRTDWDNLTEIHCKRCRHYLGEYQHATDSEITAVVKEAKKQNDIVFNLYAYIHSGISLSLNSFHGTLPQGHAEFDSGQCGFIIVRRKDMLENFGKKRWTKKLRQKAYKIAKSDVETFTAYLNGTVYEYVIDDGDDRCGGYYDIDDAITEAKSVIDSIIESENKVKDSSESVILNPV